MSELPPPGWYDDPEQPGKLRFWDGRHWTDTRHDDVRRPASAPRAPAATTRPDLAATLPAAGWWQRAGALLLDAVIVMVALVVVAIPLSAAGDDAAVAGMAVVAGLGFLVYPWLWLGTHEGQTIGRRAVAIRVVERDGTPVGTGRAFLRELPIKWALAFFGLPLLLSYLWPLWERNQRALHDLMADTRVVRAERPVPVTPDAFGNPI